MTSYVEERRLVTWDEIVGLLDEWWHPPSDRRDRTREMTMWDAYNFHEVRAAVGLLADAGLYDESEDGIALTDAGDVFVTAWLGYMKER